MRVINAHQGGGSTLLDDALFAYHAPLDPSTPAVDQSGNGRNGTLQNGATRATINGNVAYSFDGTNDRLSCPSVTRPTQWTISAWISPSTHPACDIVFSGSGPNSYLGLAVLGGNIRVYESDGTSSKIYQPHAFNSTNYPTGQWTHILATADTTRLRFYKNGTQVGSGLAYTGGSVVAAAMFLGGTAIGAFSGGIGDVRFFSRVVTSEEMALLAASYGADY